MLTAICQNYHLNPAALTAVKACSKLITTFFYQVDYMAPLIFAVISFSPVSPVYTAIRSLLKVLDRILHIERFVSRSNLVTILIILTTGAPTSLGGVFLMATMGTCILISGYGVLCLYVWTLAIVPGGGPELPFNTALHMYHCLRHVMILHSEIARDFVAICLHHATLVVLSTGALYSMITELAKGNEMSVILVFSCVALILVCVWIEIFAIYFTAMSSTASNEFLREMRLKHGENKYRRRALRCLLPNYVNLEVVGSVDTSLNGVKMEYFANYLVRVTDNTISLLLTYK